MENEKIYKEYLKKRDLLLDYKLCCAYLDMNASISRVAERILMNKFRKAEQRMHLNKAIVSIKDKHNATISIPKLGYNNTAPNVLKNFVKNHFDVMVASVKRDGLGNYPIRFKEIIDKK